MDYTLDLTKMRMLGGAIFLIIILNLAGFISGLVAMDDDWKVLGDNWGKYAYLIIMSIVYLIAGLALAGGLASSFSGNVPEWATLYIKLNL